MAAPPDNVWCYVSTTGAAGPITFGAALDGYRAPRAGDAGALVTYKIRDGKIGSKVWETGRGVLAYNSSTGVWTVTRNLLESSTGAALNLAGPSTDIMLTLSGADVAQIGPWQRKSAAYQSIRGDRLFCTVPAGGFTVTLPAAPFDLDEVWIKDATRGFSNANPLVVAVGAAPAGQLIGGLASPLNLNVAGAEVHLVFNATTNSWEF